MPGRPHLRTAARVPGGRVAALLGLTTTLALGGCGGSAADAPDLTAQEKAACAVLVDSLPAGVADQQRRSTARSGGATASWGDPPIELRCGVPSPAGLTRTSQCITANGVDWFVPEKGSTDQSTDVVMTAIGRKPLVEVRLPAQYRPPLAAMVDLAPALEAHTEVVRRCR